VGTISLNEESMSNTADRCAAAWLDANVRLARATPKGFYAEQGDAVALVNGCGINSLNMVASIAVEPDLAALDAMAAQVARIGVPWSILVRAEARDAVAELAARHGLTGSHDVVMMARAAADAVLPAEDSQIRRVGSATSDVYTAVLAEGFEIPAAVVSSLMSGGVLDAPGFTGYLAEASGRPVATGLGIDSPGMIGVYNIAVAPGARRRGIGRAVTARVMVDGFAVGADAAYLQSSTAGRPLYESMGFQQVDAWPRFTPPPAGDR
jgi:ribosomal protein S18 acetylase RimI-like enzyme